MNLEAARQCRRNRHYELLCVRLKGQIKTDTKGSDEDTIPVVWAFWHQGQWYPEAISHLDYPSLDFERVILLFQTWGKMAAAGMEEIAYLTVFHLSMYLEPQGSWRTSAASAPGSMSVYYLSRCQK